MQHERRMLWKNKRENIMDIILLIVLLIFATFIVSVGIIVLHIGVCIFTDMFVHEFV